ncbi:right-handed parallel beta-helix repeat-containing protein [bacterium]|nr:right-handed parallel beta-helix repeat-containing protein [bacterium]
MRHLCRSALSILALSFLFSPALAGIITVNVADDGDAPDGALTLREAILIAEGQRVPFESPNPDIPDEISLVSGDYGAGVADVIQVAIGEGGLIGLGDYLPPLTDSGDTIEAGSTNAIDGSALSADPDNAGLLLVGNNYTVHGFTVQNFPGTGVRIWADDCTVEAMFIKNCAGNGLVLTQAERAVVRSVASSGNAQNGVLLSDGSAHNFLSDIFSYSNQMNGFLISGDDVSSNTMIQLSAGVDENKTIMGNQQWGIRIDEGAWANRIGDAGNDSAISYSAGNSLGGVLLDNAHKNTLHSLVIGGTEQEDVWPGNGTGPGMVVQGGSTYNKLGWETPNGVIAIGGHAADGLLVQGKGTNNNDFTRFIIGWVDILSSDLQPNQGHGIEIRGGTENNRFGYTPDPSHTGRLNTHNEINATGDGKHALFINGDDPQNPIKNLLFEHYHMGDRGRGDNLQTIGGDVIHVSGNVDGVIIGLLDHPNSTNGSKGWGLVFDGPNVQNIELRQIICGQFYSSRYPNLAGGMLITNGAHNIVFATGEEMRSSFAGNKGPGIRVDATGVVPSDIKIRNLYSGQDEIGFTIENEGNGIEILGPESGNAVALSNIDIGGFQEGEAVVSSGNTENGLYMRNVSGVEVRAGTFGLNPAGDSFRPNLKNGVLLSGCHDIRLGSEQLTSGRNFLSANDVSGIKFENHCYDVDFFGNYIGLLPNGSGRQGNEYGVWIASPPPANETLRIGGASAFMDGQSGGALQQGNVISGNHLAGIYVATEGQSTEELRGILIEGNLIGANSDATEERGNLEAGIRIEGSNVKGVTIGSRTDTARRNVVSGNWKNGIEIKDEASGWALYNNIIGLDPMQTIAIPNKENGIKLSNLRDGKIGTTSEPHAGNVISGNTKAGIYISDEVVANVRITHNYIGTNSNSINPFPNNDGIHIMGPNGAGGDRLLIGGTNNGIANDDRSRFDEGNVISGNTRDGIRVEAPSSRADTSIFGIDIQGNIIGTMSGGRAAQPNGAAGVRVLGDNILDTTIGKDGFDARGNVISANGGDGIRVESNAQHVEIYRNHIGCGMNKADVVANTRNGIWLRDGAQRAIIKENIIHYNKQRGILASDSNTRRNKFTQNSIHLNERGAIYLEDGANDSIQTPTLDFLYKPGRSTTRIPLSTIANGTVEVFTDRIEFTKDGYWGQAKEYELTGTADGDGDYTVNIGSFSNRGIITATVTDSQDNTSALSPWAIGVLTHAIPDDPAYLVANKPTAVRIFANTGNDAQHRLGGHLVVNDVMNVAPQRKDILMRPFAGYDGDAPGRRLGHNALEFVFTPPAGIIPVEAILEDTSGGRRGHIMLGDFYFQRTTPFTVGFASFGTPPANGGTGLELPTSSNVQAALKFLGDVYPFDPQAFAQNLTMMPPILFDQLPWDSGKQREMAVKVNERRTRTRLPGGKTPEYGAGFMSGATGFESATSQSTLKGYTYPSIPKVTIVRDRTGGRLGHGGKTLAHEFGHTDPFDLGDTYADGDLSDDINPRPTDPTKVTNAGILVFEEDFAYSPTGVGPGSNRPAQIGTQAGSRLDVVDFMGNQNYAWVERQAWHRIFLNVGGTEPSGSRAIDTVTTQALNTHVIVTGAIGTGDAVSFDPIVRKDGEAVRYDSPVPSDYVIALVGAGDAILDSVPLYPDSQVETMSTIVATGEEIGGYGDSGVFGFSAVLQDNAAATGIIVTKNGSEIGRLGPSPATPTMSITTTLSGTLPRQPFTLEWTSTDADTRRAEELFVDVFYTPDDGETLLPILTNIANTGSAEVSTDGLPGSAAGRFIVQASDGWNTKSDTTAAIELSDEPPVVAIVQPDPEDLAFLANVPVTFSGAAYDLEEGSLFGDSLVWSIIGDSQFSATGTNLVAEFSDSGPTTIRLTATDSKGNEAFTEVTVNVLPPLFTPTDIADILLGFADPTLDADSNMDGVIDTGDVSVSQETELVR